MQIRQNTAITDVIFPMSTRTPLQIHCRDLTVLWKQLDRLGIGSLSKLLVNNFAFPRGVTLESNKTGH